MHTYFWYAELDNKPDSEFEPPSDCGLVVGETPLSAFDQAGRDARAKLPRGGFTIKQFNKVS